MGAAKKTGKGGNTTYNPQLETFLRVAEAAFVTPTAVIQQIICRKRNRPCSFLSAPTGG